LLELEIVIFWWLKFAIFAIKKKSPQQHDQVNILENFLKKSSHVEEEASYEITKIFWEDLGEISNFFLLKSPYLANTF
jgi:hypothetical protein